MNIYKNSFRPMRHFLVLAIVSVMLWPPALRADTRAPMNLRDMCQRAERIFRGAIIAAVPGTVRIGGGELPVVTYRIRVEEAFKGDFQMLNGMRVAEVCMLAIPQRKEVTQTRTTFFLDMPQLEVGQKYLLLTTRPSAIGMSAPVGLGQGCFRITGQGNGEEAVNRYGNVMLFKGMETSAMASNAGAQRGGPIKYAALAAHIRRLLEEGREKR